MKARLHIGIVLGALALGVAGPVLAIEIFGIKLFEPDTPEDVELIDPLYYDISLTLTPDTNRVRKAVERNSTLIRTKDRPALGRAGLLTTARADYGRILESLYGVGRYGGSVSILIEGAEASGLPLNTDLPDRVTIKVVVDPGPIYRFGAANVTNAPKTLDTEETGYISGEVAFAESVGQTAIAAIDAWRAEGFAKADLGGVEVLADHEARQVDATIAIESGPLARFGAVSISGSEAVDEDFLHYMTDIAQGEVFAGRSLDDARRRLLKLDTFRRVTVQEAETIDPDGELDVVVEVEDRKPRRLGAGVTVSSLDGFGIEGFWLHRNIFGRAERLRFDAVMSGIDRELDPDQFNWQLSVNFLKPGALTPDTDFSLTLAAERELAENYDARAVMITGGFATAFNDELSGSIDVSAERSFTRDDLGERDFVTLGLSAGLTFDDRDVPLNATKGLYADLDISPFYEINFENSGVRAVAEARSYYAFGLEDQFVLAGRVKLGSLIGIEAEEAPNSALFFSGGGGSIRGYAYGANGVDTPAGVTGGRSLLELSGEIRTNLSESWGVVGFIDTGVVGADPVPDLSDPFKTGVGVGLRFNTGLGPIRVDVARGLERKSSDPQVGVYIGLGQAF